MTRKMTSEQKPDSLSVPGEWHEFTFRISVDAPVDWNKFSEYGWAATIGKYTAWKMAMTGLTDEEIKNAGEISSLIMSLKIERVESFVTDADLDMWIGGLENE